MKVHIISSVRNKKNSSVRNKDRICILCKFIYLFIFGCVGSSFLCEGFLQLRQAGATLHCGARASHYRGLSCCGAQAPDAQAQQLWLTGPVAPRHVGSSQTRARTRVPCIDRQILNHCATREALAYFDMYEGPSKKRPHWFSRGQRAGSEIREGPEKVKEVGVLDNSFLGLQDEVLNSAFSLRQTNNSMWSHVRDPRKVRS